MRSSTRLLASQTVAVTVTIATLLTASATGDTSTRHGGRMISLPPRQLKQIAVLENRLVKRHGADAWYVFQLVGYKPHVSHRMHLTRRANRVHNDQRISLNYELKTRTFKVRGSADAAVQIWQAAHSRLIVSYKYRVFDDKEQAEEFYESLRETIHE